MFHCNLFWCVVLNKSFFFIFSDYYEYETLNMIRTG